MIQKQTYSYSKKIVLGLFLIVFLIPQQAQSVFFGNHKTLIGLQFSYGNVCQKVIKVDIYCFGIKIGSTHRFETIKCESEVYKHLGRFEL